MSGVWIYENYDGFTYKKGTQIPMSRRRRRCISYTPYVLQRLHHTHSVSI